MTRTGITSTRGTSRGRTAVDTDPDRGSHGRHADLRLRHATHLVELLEARADLRGVHAFADLVDEALRWSA
jgi:hypothetical protein